MTTVWRSEVWNGLKGWSQRVGRTVLLLEAPGENLFPCLFQLLEVPTFSLACDSFLHLPSASLCLLLLLSHLLYLWPSCLSLLRTLEIAWGHVDNSGCSLCLKIMNFATYERSLMSRKVTYLQVLGIVPWAKSLHSGLTLCNPMDCSPRGSSVHGILQVGILEWVAMPSSRGSSWPRDWTCVSYGFCIGRRVLYH